MEEMIPFVDGIEALADAAAREGKKIRVALDVETEFVDPKVSSRREEPFFWHICLGRIIVAIVTSCTFYFVR